MFYCYTVLCVEVFFSSSSSRRLVAAHGINIVFPLGGMHKRGSLKHPFTRWPIDIFLYLNGRLLNGSCLFSAGNLLEKFKNVCFLKDDVGHDDSAKLNRFIFFKKYESYICISSRPWFFFGVE